MKVHAAFLAVLALSATLGLVAAQDRPAGSRSGRHGRSGRGVTGEGVRRPGHHRPARLVRQGVQREGRQGARRPVHAGRRDRGRGRRGHAGPRRHRRAVHGDLPGERRRHARRGHRLPAVPRDRSSPSRRARRPSRPGPDSPAAHEPVQRDLRPPGRPLAARPDPRRAARGGLPARPAPGTRMDARRVGQRERRRGRLHHLQVVGRRQLPAPGLRRQGRGPHRPERHPAHRLGRPAGAVPHVGLRRRRRVRRGADVARRRPLGHQGLGRPVGRTVGLVHDRDHAPRQGPDPLGDARPDGRRRGVPGTDQFDLVRRPPSPGK